MTVLLMRCPNCDGTGYLGGYDDDERGYWLGTKCSWCGGAGSGPVVKLARKETAELKKEIAALEKELAAKNKRLDQLLSAVRQDVLTRIGVK